jgi:phosphinothricin acetyltransferase
VVEVAADVVTTTVVEVDVVEVVVVDVVVEVDDVVVGDPVERPPPQAAKNNRAEAAAIPLTHPCCPQWREVCTLEPGCGTIGSVVVIRDATADDLPAITVIYNALLASTTHEWTETVHSVEERREWLDGQRADGLPALVATECEEVVGWATYGDFRDSVRWPGYLPTVEHSIHVREDRWGRGIGRALIDALIEHARRAGKRVMVAAIDSENLNSIQFHERLGFVEVARMPEVGEKFGRRLDLVLMQRMLD